MQRPVGNRWASPQGTEPRFRFNPPQLAGSPSQTGYQRFQQGPQGSALRFANHSFPQQGTRGENRMQFNRDGPLIRPSQFSGPPHGPRPPLNYQQNSGNPFGPVPRFRNFPQNGPPGMMRGPRPDFNFPNGPRFHKAQFNKVRTDLVKQSAVSFFFLCFATKHSSFSKVSHLASLVLKA